jgi:threonine dehydratase
VGDKTLALCHELVDEYVTVTDEEICRAILFLLEGEKTVAEGAGAAGVAALMCGKVKNIEGACMMYYFALFTEGIDVCYVFICSHRVESGDHHLRW